MDRDGDKGILGRREQLPGVWIQMDENLIINVFETIERIAAPPQPAGIFGAPVLYWLINTASLPSCRRTFCPDGGAAA